MGDNVRFVEARGARFAVRTFGSGTPVLALHWGFATGEGWIEIARAAAIEKVLVIAPDARGHGLSTATPDSRAYAIPELARDAIAIADELGLGRAPIVGSSMGTRTAVYIAANYPERVASLGLSLPPPTSHQAAVPRSFVALAGDIQRYGFDRAIEAVKQRNAYVADNISRMPRESLPSVLTGLSGSIEWDVTEQELARITCPTLVLGREGDAGHTVEAAQFYAANIGGAQLNVVSFDLIDLARPELLAWAVKNSHAM